MGCASSSKLRKLSLDSKNLILFLRIMSYFSDHLAWQQRVNQEVNASNR